MARILKGSRSFGINLDGNVGPKGGNERSDVGIVQYALLLLSSGVQDRQPTGMGPPTGNSRRALSVPGQGPIAVDGFFGPQTRAYIDAYQADRVRSPGPGSGPLPPPDGNFGNFRRTSWNFGLLEEDVRRNILDAMRFDPRCPTFLKELFLS